MLDDYDDEPARFFMKTYEVAPLDVNHRAATLIEHHYPEIKEAGVTFDFLFASNENGDAITHGGYPAIGLCRIISLKDRAAGRSDAEITLDAKAWEDMTELQRNALLDHELNHVVVKRDKQNAIAFDDLSRPKLKSRKHDYQFGWFTDIAKRHGEASPEVYQAKLIWDKDGQAFFPMLTESNGR